MSCSPIALVSLTRALSLHLAIAVGVPGNRLKHLIMPQWRCSLNVINLGLAPRLLLFVSVTVN